MPIGSFSPRHLPLSIGTPGGWEPSRLLWAHFSVLVREPSEIGEMGLDSFCPPSPPQLEQGHLLGVGPLGASTLPVNVSPPGGEGKGEAGFRATWGEGGPLLLSTGEPCHGEQNCSERPERGGPREEAAARK